MSANRSSAKRGFGIARRSLAERASLAQTLCECGENWQWLRYLDTAPTNGSMAMTMANGAKSPGLCVRMDEIPCAWQVATMLPS